MKTMQMKFSRLENRDGVGMDSRPPNGEAGAPDLWQARLRGNDDEEKNLPSITSIG